MYEWARKRFLGKIFLRNSEKKIIKAWKLALKHKKIKKGYSRKFVQKLKNFNVNKFLYIFVKYKYGKT